MPALSYVTRPVLAHVVGRVSVHVIGPVTVSRDGWDWAAFWISSASGLAAVIAIIIAVAAIRWAAKIGQEADRALIRERQLAFELSILARIAELETIRPPGVMEALPALIAALPVDALPLHRSTLNANKPPVPQIISGAPNEIMTELLEAIQSRKIETGPPQLTVRRSSMFRIR